MKLWVIVALFITVGFASAVFYFISSQPAMPNSPTLPSNAPHLGADDFLPKKVSSPNPQSSAKYVDYSSGLLNSESSRKRVLFFYADWCPTCRPVDNEIKSNLGRIPEDVEIIRVNYNDDFTDEEEKTLARQYGVTYQHTFVQIDGNGEEITKWNGGGLDNILKSIQ